MFAPKGKIVEFRCPKPVVQSCGQAGISARGGPRPRTPWESPPGKGKAPAETRVVPRTPSVWWRQRFRGGAGAAGVAAGRNPRLAARLHDRFWAPKFYYFAFWGKRPPLWSAAARARKTAILAPFLQLIGAPTMRAGPIQTPRSGLYVHENYWAACALYKRRGGSGRSPT